MKKEITQPDAITTVSDTLDSVTGACWAAILHICGKNLPLLLAVTDALREIARVNNTCRIVREIESVAKQPKKEENANEKP